MIRVSVMYPKSDGITFDIDYYCNSHMALVRRLLGDTVKGIAVDHGVDGPYMAIGHILFDSVDVFRANLAKHGPALLADVPNYTTVRPTFQVSEIRM